MEFFLFRSERDPHYFGFISDATGLGLPGDFAPWRQPSDDELPPREELFAAISSTAVLRTIEAGGHHVARFGDSNVSRPFFGRARGPQQTFREDPSASPDANLAYSGTAATER
jgi:hypothetical protein